MRRAAVKYLLIACASGLAFFLAIGLAVDRTPTPDDVYVRSLQPKTVLYECLPNVPDVVMLGNSRTAWAIRPPEVEAVLKGVVERPVSVFNFGVSGCNALTIRAVVDVVLQGTTRPKAIVIGVDPKDATMADINKMRRDVRDTSIEITSPSMWRDLDHPWLKWEAGLTTIVPGRRNWPNLRKWWTMVRDAKDRAPKAFVLHPDGWDEDIRVPTPSDERRRRFNKRCGHDRDTPLEPVLQAAFHAALRRAKEAGIAVILYEHPFPPYLQEANRSGVYDQWLAWVEQEAASMDVPFIRGVYAEAGDEAFFNLGHVNPAHSAEYSRVVAKALAPPLKAAIPALSPAAMDEGDAIAKVSRPARQAP